MSLQHARGLGLRRFREPAQMHEQLVDVNGVRKGRDYGEVICGITNPGGFPVDHGDLSITKNIPEQVLRQKIAVEQRGWAIRKMRLRSNHGLSQ